MEILDYNLDSRSNNPYSDAIIYDGVAYVSGNISYNRDTGEYLNGSIEDETKNALKNLEYILNGLGATQKDVLSVTAYLTSMGDFEGFNSVYKEFFSEYKPARVTVAVHEIIAGLKVEISAIVAVKN